MCVHTPRDSLRQGPGQSTFPPTQPGAPQDIKPSPLQAKQTFSPGPGPATSAGAGVDAALVVTAAWLVAGAWLLEDSDGSAGQHEHTGEEQMKRETPRKLSGVIHNRISSEFCFSV